MKIGLVAVDSHNYPNYALMKISAYHKAKGDEVEWANPLFGDYDRLYMSKIFTFTPDDTNFYYAKEIVRGGTGYDVHLLQNMENQCVSEYIRLKWMRLWLIKMQKRII